MTLPGRFALGKMGLATLLAFMFCALHCER